MKVCLIQPPQRELTQPRAYISLGIAYIGAVLEEAGMEVTVWNLADMSVEQFKGKGIPYADWYGISCVTATYPEVVKLSALLRATGKPFVIGGIHPSVLPGQVLWDTKCEYVVVGEGEYALRDIVLGMHPRGIVEADLITDLDALPFPARHLFSYHSVVDVTGIHGQERGEKATTVVTSRGCPFHCAFCTKTPHTEKPRFRSIGNIVAELNKVVEDYGVSHIRFVDDIFTLREDRIIKLCKRMLDEGLGLTWVCITRTDCLSTKLLRWMKRAGCKEVHIGVESGSQRMLNLMRKGLTVKQNLDAIQRIKRSGLAVKTYLMYGFPGETPSDVEATKQFIRDARPDKFTLSRFTPLPASTVWNKRNWFYPDEGNSRYLELKRWLKAELTPKLEESDNG